MSHYPSPYQLPENQPLPQWGYDPLQPAKTAGILAVVVGALMLVCGGCLGVFVMLPWDQLPPEQVAEFQRLDEQTRSQYGFGLRPVMTTGAVMMLIPGVLMIVLGILVRRGGLGTIVTLIVLTGLVLLLFVIELIGGLVRAPGDPQQMGGACLLLLPMAVLGTLMYFLIRAARAVPAIRAMRQQQEALYWQYQQNQQQFGQPPPQQRQQSPPPPQQGWDPFDRRQ